MIFGGRDMMRNSKFILFILFIATIIIGLGLLYNQPEASYARDKPPISLPWSEPPDYRITYLISKKAVTTNSFLSPSLYLEYLNAQTTYSWDEVIQLDDTQPIDAIIIDNSAIDLVDVNWLRTAYRKGVVVAFFNVYGPHVADILNAPVIAQDEFASASYQHNFFVIVSSLVLGQNHEDISRIMETLYIGGAYPQNITQPVIVNLNRTQDDLRYPDDPVRFSVLLVNQIDQIREEKQKFESSQVLSNDSSNK